MNLRERDRHVRELMDDPDADPRRLAATLQRFDTVNRLISGWGRVYRRWVRPQLSALDRPARILDLGCGGGDVIARIAALAAADGLSVEGVGVDPDPRAIAVARAQRGERPGLRFEVTDSGTLRSGGERFDLVISNHVLHHLDDDELHRFTGDSLALSRGPVLHADIERGAAAYALYAVGITPLAPGTFLRTDGLRSIRRSYRAPELARALPPTTAWSVHQPVPFRLLAVGNGHA